MYSKCGFKLYFKKVQMLFTGGMLYQFTVKKHRFSINLKKHYNLNTDSNKMAPVQNINIIQTFSKFNLHKVKA